MISSTQFQLAYNRLYKYIREYIWDFETINALADLEIETYKSFPDLDTLSKCLSTLKRLVNNTEVLLDDEDLNDAFERFQGLLDTKDTLYANLITFKTGVV